ncbi:MAG: hypothetical protein Q9165_005726 [Trypethelium subeluteriae]
MARISQTSRPTMPPPKPILGILSCNGCRYRMLSIFAASAGIHLPPWTASRLLPLRRGFHPRRTFAAVTRRPSQRDLKLSDSIETALKDQPHSTLRDENSEEVGQNTSSSDNSTFLYTPWYLREHVTPTPSNHDDFSERQFIPDLPENPPPILQPILEHISTDLGLDDLSLLDLRNLDPPPALGSNLIMVIGTARSEKHLHVSADRHCRWLRSTYKLHPFADGLLGRNEMKLKLRRKARRSKILQNVGASEPDEADDGIRSGWVCVNIGKVEPAASQDSEGEEPRIIGFGSGSDGVRLVVQMFTEEKRGQFDLESLWGGALRRAAREEEKERETVILAQANREKAEIKDGPRPIDGRFGNFWSHGTVPIGARTAVVQQRPVFGNGQSRVFHSTAAHFNLTEFQKQIESSLFDPKASLGISVDRDTRSFVQDAAPNKGGSAEVLRSLLERLQKMPANRARDSLGQTGWAVTDSGRQSPLIHSFTNNFPPFPDTPHWKLRVELARYVVQLMGTGRSNLMDALTDMQAAGERISKEIYLDVLKTMVEGKHDDKKLSYVFDILDMMACEGHSILEERIFMLLLEAVIPPSPQLARLGISGDELGSDQASAPGIATISKETLADQERVLAVMDHFLVSFTTDGPYLSLLRTCARARHWPGFFFIWSLLPRRMLPRSREMYTFFYRTVAEAGEKDLIRKNLHDAVSDMKVEEPRIEFDVEMAKLIMECIRVTVPDNDTAAPKVSERLHSGEWGSLWGRCQRVLRMESQ